MRTVVHSWRVASSSGKGQYETLRYADGSTSCNCMGWTRHVDANGNRQCRHTRAVHSGQAEVECMPGTSLDMANGINTSTRVPIRQMGNTSTQTAFAKKSKTLEKVPARKIMWKK